MKIQAVLVEVEAENRDAYLKTWFELAAALLSMEIRSDLYTQDGADGRFLELTWFEAGNEAALSDDRVVRLYGQLEGASARREGDLRLFEPEGPGPPGGT